MGVTEALGAKRLAYGNYAYEYRKNAANGASPVGLVIMLYDGALRFMELGKSGIIDNDLQKQDINLRKAQRIVLELMATLDMQAGGEISQNLFALYTYVVDQLVLANVKDEPECVDRAMKTMSELRESWVEVDKIVRMPAPEVPIAA